MLLNISLCKYSLFGQEVIYNNQIRIVIKDGSDSSKLGFADISLYKLNRSIQVVNSDVDGILSFYSDSVLYVEFNYATYYPSLLKISQLMNDSVVFIFQCDELLKTGIVREDTDMKKLVKMINKFSEKWIKNKKTREKDFRKIDEFYIKKIHNRKTHTLQVTR